MTGQGRMVVFSYRRGMTSLDVLLMTAITVGVNDETKDGTPVLFTANIGSDPHSFSPLYGLADTPYLAPNGLPFGDVQCIIVLNGGAAFTLKPSTLNKGAFSSVGATNTVLYP
jgi:hypothetical protein